MRLNIWWQNEGCHSVTLIESFNGTFRAECLNRWVFADGREAQTIIEQWRQEYNHYRPHSSLGCVPPAAFAEQSKLSLNSV